MPSVAPPVRNVKAGIKSRRATSATLFWYGDYVTRDVQESITYSLEDIANECVKLAKMYVPVRTGRLRKSIRVNTRSLKKTKIPRRVRDQHALTPQLRIARSLERRISWGSYGVHYALHIEYGHRLFGRDDRFVRGARYLRRAAEEVYPKFMGSFLNKYKAEAGMHLPGARAVYSHPGQFFKLPERVLGF